MVRAGHSLCGRPFLIVCWGKLNFAVLALGTAEKIMRHPLFASGRAVTVMLAVLFAVVVVSCELPENPHDETSIFGTWVSTYNEYFIISETTLNNKFSDYATGELSDGYALKDLYLHFTNSSSGYIYGVYSRAAEPDFSYSDTAPDVGKWYALYFNNYTGNSMSIAGAGKTGGKTSAENLADAITEFTVENGYFAFFSECAKSE